MRGPITNMADTEKNGEIHKAGNVVQEFTDAGPEGSGKTRCGWGPFSPDCCQTFRKPVWFLFWLSWGGAMQGLIVNGFVNVVISTIERRFDLSSTESGAIASCYDIAAVICLIPVSYLGGRGQKPLYLGVGFLILAIGSFTFSIPHFSTDTYQYGDANGIGCVKGSNDTGCGQSSRSLSDYKYVFFLGQLLHGVGATPLYTLGTVYLDENLPVRSAALYQGIFYAFAILGPAVGYLAGGAFLDIYTDFNKIDTSTLLITKENPKWVGAWWLGFVISAFVTALIAAPMCGFPKRLPGSEKFKAEREVEVYHKGSGSKNREQPVGIRDIWISFKVLIVNPTFMFLNLAAACEGIMVSGFSTFAPKFIEYQFGLSSGVAAMYVGLAAIPAGGGATFAGGYIVKRFSLTVRGILKFCMCVTVVSIFLVLTFIIHCPYTPFAGINIDYHQVNRSIALSGNYQLDNECNAGCGCNMENYFPVCGRDGLMYYNPCYAGCTSHTDDYRYYSNCSCINYNFAQANVTGAHYWLAEQGKCASDCQWLPLFLPLLALLMCSVFVTSMPALAATLRCVPQEKRSFALGIQWIIARCLGSIPGPILFGKVIDLTCLLWQESCDGEGACFFYDKKQMSFNLLAIGIAGTVISTLCFLCALLFYRTGAVVDNGEVDVTLPATNGDSRHTSVTNLTAANTPANTPATTPSTEHPSVSVHVLGGERTSDKDRSTSL